MHPYNNDNKLQQDDSFKAKDKTMRPRDFSPFFLRNASKLSIILMAFSVIFITQSDTNAQAIGVFDKNSNVGQVKHAGSSRFIQSSNEYQITGGGANIWGREDAFQYLWKKDSGDFSLTTRIRWIGDGKNAHRKAGWMIRQNLAADSPYADAVVHGDGLISLQFRKNKSGPTGEIQSPISAPAYLRLERHGEVFSLYISEDGKEFQPVGSISIALAEPVYVGLVVCSHDDTTTETAIFSKVDFESL